MYILFLPRIGLYVTKFYLERKRGVKSWHAGLPVWDFVFFCMIVDCCLMDIYSTSLDFSLKNDIGTILYHMLVTRDHLKTS
jgi:hypothetical protein